MVTRFLPVAGTHGWRGQQSGGWWQAGSAWLQFLEARGCVPYNAARPFYWSTDLDGISWWPWRWGRSQHRVWSLAAHNLFAYLVPPVHGGDDNGVAVSGAATRIVAHSHGGQVALMAAAYGLQIDTLITVCTPVRGDLADVIEAARPRIRRWVHVHSDGSDRWAVLGGLGDGVVGVQRAHRRADVNVGIPRSGHTGVLEDPAWFRVWDECGLLAELRGAAAGAAAERVRL